MLACLFPGAGAAATFTTTVTADAGGGSLRAAILAANATPGVDEIRFDIPGVGPHTIVLTSTLPRITDPVSLDGRTQPGFTSDPLIVVDGRVSAVVWTITSSASGTALYGLTTKYGAGTGILIEGASVTLEQVVLTSTAVCSGACATAIAATEMPTLVIRDADLSFEGAVRTGVGLTITGTGAVTLDRLVVRNRTTGIAVGSASGSLLCSLLQSNDLGVAATGALIIADNHFVANTIALAATSLALAEANYWGAPDGPTNLGGSGDRFNGAVDAEPFSMTVAACAPPVPGASSNTPPSALCRDVTACAPMGQCAFGVSVNAGSNDPDLDPIVIVQTPPGPYALGTTSVTLSATDGLATSTCAAIARIDDCEPPVLTCSTSTVVECDVALGAALDLGVASAVDTCSGVDPTSGPGVRTFALGTTETTFSIADLAGNTTTCTTTVIVQDTQAPLLTLLGANPTVVECGVDIYADPGPTVVEVCSPNLSVLVGGDIVDTTTVATYRVDFTSTDAAANSTTVERVVEVIDTTAPLLTLTGTTPYVLECDRAIPYLDPGVVAVDACAGDLEARVRTDGAVDSGRVGSYPLVFEVVDDRANTSSVARDVEIVDTTRPSLRAPASVTVEADRPSGTSVSNARIAAFLRSVVVTDACDPAPAISHNASGSLPIGTTTVAFVATDRAGLRGVAMGFVTVVDTTPPVTTVSFNDADMDGRPNSFALSASDTASGVATTTFAFDQQVPTAYPGGAVEVPPNVSSLAFGSIDRAGNAEMTRTTSITDRLVQTRDGGVDGGVLAMDASTSADPVDAGCSCETTRAPNAGWPWFILLMLVAVRRRK